MNAGTATGISAAKAAAEITTTIIIISLLAWGVSEEENDKKQTVYMCKRARVCVCVYLSAHFW